MKSARHAILMGHFCILFGCGSSTARDDFERGGSAGAGQTLADAGQQGSTGGSEAAGGGVGSGGRIDGLGGAATGGTGGTTGSSGGTTGSSGGYQCAMSALPLACGDSFAHSTVDQGDPNQYAAYACSARGYDGRESVYAFQSVKNCQVEVRVDDMSVDLNLFIAPGCDPSACAECIPDDSRMVMTTECSFNPVAARDSESVTFDAVAGEVATVIIDGYEQAQGSYTITANCICSG